MVDRLLEGKVALVTGAARGIGRAVSALFAEHGAKLVLLDNGCDADGKNPSADPVEHTALALRESGAEAIAHYGDVADAAVCSEAVRKAVEAFGAVNILVNLAGIARDRTLLKMTDEDFTAVYRTSVLGTLHATQAAARQMAVQKRGGHIVHCTSMAGLFGNYGQANSAAAAAAIYGLTRTMAIELKKHEVRVNAIAPVARTRLTEPLPMFEAMPEESYGAHFVAPAVLFLASKLCGELSGEVLAVAGSKVSVYRMLESDGVMGEDPKSPWSAQEIAKKFWEASKIDLRL